ncbi:uncharacterized protein LOC110849039 [Folsomia candida]|uniref:Uncharacterized protein n=1 Tax=Folsomia candida TaxID=158441 RepID=A0A226ECN0_FOLCA|nr:uncharacterized protein LOC110849039 [Folsomia candida]OXA55333.1 hypothetical protein Fcan01_09316 [Folsomia candida]
MCCSMKATVFFLSSLHIWYAVTQAVIIAPLVVSSISTQLAECILVIIYSCVFFCAGFLIFLGTDQESTMLVGTGAIMLLVILGKRYIVMYHGMLLKPTLPEGDFLNPYGTTVPVIFSVLLYIFYMSILFCYHNELSYATPRTCLTPLSCRRQFPQSTSLSLSLSPSGNLNPHMK